jgi:hypothetical protein
MLKKVFGLASIVLVGVLLSTLVMAVALPSEAEAARNGRQGGARGTGSGAAAPQVPPASSPTSGELSASEVEALSMALDDEYKAWAVYDQVIDDFGAVWPFTSIQKAEEAHIAALVTLFERYGLDVPANGWPSAVPSYDTLADACAAGVQAEIDNAALYDELFSMVDNADIIRVFESLQQASLTKHLPAFERCAP